MFAQSDSLQISEIIKRHNEAMNDSIPSTLPTPSTSKNNALQQVKISKDSLDATVEYDARDSMKIDAKNQKIFLFGEANIAYTSIKLKADYIEFDWGNNIVTARGITDSLGRMSGKPEFTDGQQEFKSGEIRYNFKTQKGLITDASTIQQNLYVQGKRTKFVSALGDSTKSDVIYNRDAIFTTCDRDHPHFGIRSNKQKVIPNKLVVIGPSNVEISDIPTPLWLPFGFFPISTGESTGLIFPKGYEYDPQWGFGLSEVGWYFPINDYINFIATGDIYVKGTFKIKTKLNYKRRYKYNGNFNFEYDNYNNENPEDGIRSRDQAYIFQLSHRQDSKSNPNRTFGGSINFQTNNAQRKSYNDAQNVLTSQLSSNFSYTENFPGRPISLSVGLSHSQNTNTQQVTLSAPTVNFRLQRVHPFKRKNPVGGSKWYEDIAVDYIGEAKNRLTGTDTTFFTQETLDNAQYGARHKATLSTKFRVLKHFNVTPNANYEEVWYFKTLQKEFDPTIDTVHIIENGITTIDTTSLGTVSDTLVTGFTPFRNFNAGASMNTKLFGTLLFKKGFLRGVRHQVTPSVGFTYAPNQSSYFSEVRTNALDESEVTEYNIFKGGVYSSSPSNSERMSLNYSIGNVVEAKLFSKKDSTTRNVAILRSLNIGGNYNFAADSLNFSQISASTNAKFFNGITNLAVNAVFDPYIRDEDDRRVQTYYWRTNSKPLRFERATLSFTSRITVKKLREMFTGERDKNEDPGAAPAFDPNSLNEGGDFEFDRLAPPVIEDVTDEEKRKEEEEAKKEKITQKDFLSLFENFGINHTYRFNFEKNQGVDTLITSAHTVNLSGNIELTNKWSLTVGSFGFDFKNKQLTYPSMGVRRDLHCWEMGGSWQPFRGTFNFYVRVRPGSTLDFLEVPYKKTRPPRSVFD